MYDNNNHLDFHAIVQNITANELFWVEEEQKIYRKLQEERKQKEEDARIKVSLLNGLCLHYLTHSFTFLLHILLHFFYHPIFYYHHPSLFLSDMGFVIDRSFMLRRVWKKAKEKISPSKLKCLLDVSHLAIVRFLVEATLA